MANPLLGKYKGLARKSRVARTDKDAIVASLEQLVADEPEVGMVIVRALVRFKALRKVSTSDRTALAYQERELKEVADALQVLASKAAQAFLNSAGLAALDAAQHVAENQRDYPTLEELEILVKNSGFVVQRDLPTRFRDFLRGLTPAQVTFIIGGNADLRRFLAANKIEGEDEATIAARRASEARVAEADAARAAFLRPANIITLVERAYASEMRNAERFFRTLADTSFAYLQKDWNAAEGLTRFEELFTVKLLTQFNKDANRSHPVHHVGVVLDALEILERHTPTFADFDRIDRLETARQKRLNRRGYRPSRPTALLEGYVSQVCHLLDTAKERGIRRDRIEALRAKYARIERDACTGSGGPSVKARGPFAEDAPRGARRSAVVRKDGAPLDSGERVPFAALISAITCNQGMYPQELALFAATMAAGAARPELAPAFLALDVSMDYMTVLADEDTGCFAVRCYSAIVLEGDGAAGARPPLAYCEQFYVYRATFEWGEGPLPVSFTREELHFSQVFSAVEPPPVADLRSLLAQHKRR